MNNHDYQQVTTDMQATNGVHRTAFEAICEQLAPHNHHSIPLTAATDINADLNIDSVAILDLLMTIEDAYDISIPINLLADVRTVGDLADMVQNIIDGRAESSAS